MAEPLILIVESHPMLRAVLTEFVHLEGMNALVADSGRQAPALADTQPPDAVLLNSHLTNAMDGLDVLAAIRDDPQLSH